MTLNDLEGMKQEYLNILEEYHTILYMLMVLLYSLISNLGFLNVKKFNYREHLVIIMYLIANFSSILVIMATLLGITYDKYVNAFSFSNFVFCLRI